MPPQDDFQKKVLETLKKNLRAVDLSEQEPVPDTEAAVEAPVETPVEAPKVIDPSQMSTQDFNALGLGDVSAFGGFQSGPGPTSGGNKDILILPGYGGAAATSASQINFYWNSPLVPDTTGIGTSIRTTIFNYAKSATQPVLVIGGWDGTTNLVPTANYGGGSGTTAKIWIDPFIAQIDTQYLSLFSGAADTSTTGTLLFDGNYFRGVNGAGTAKSLAYFSDITGSGYVNSATGGQVAWYSSTGNTVSGNSNFTLSSAGEVLTGIWGGTAVSVAKGGTGAATLTSGYLLFGNGTSAVGTTGSNTGGQVLIAQASGAPAFKSFSGDITVDASGVVAIAANSVALGTDTTGNYALSVASSGNGISTIGTAGEGTAFTIDSNATSANTVSTIVFRDSSGNFSAGTITASLTGTASIASSSILSATTTDTSSTLYLLGSRSSTGFAGTALYVDTNISFSGSTIIASLTGTATTATRALNLDTTTDTSNTLYLLGSRTSTGIASTVAYVDSSVSVQGGTVNATTFVGALTGTATTATRALNRDITLDTTSTIYITGSRSNSSIGSTPTYVLSGVSALGNTITATTFNGSLSGTATTATNQVTTTLAGTMYLHGQTSSTGVATGTGAFVASGLSFISSTGTLGASFYTGSGIQLSGIVTSLAGSTGISVNASTGAVTVTNTGVISLTGTANQVLVNGASGVATSSNITLTTPQSIGTASSPSFADVTLTTGSNSTVAAVGSQPTSMVNKQYVDNLASGLDIHDSMRVLQTSALSANYVQTQAAGSAATGAYLISTTLVALPAIDGVTISATGTSQRVLVTGGFTGTATIGGTTPFTPASSNIANGSYYVASVGSGSSNWILVRTTDGDDNTELTGGTFTFIEEGTSYGDSGWVCSNDTLNQGAIQLGSTPITWSQFTGGGALGVGQGLTKVGNTIATNIKLTSSGSASGIGFTQFNIGGASAGGVADTGHYPTFSVRTSGNASGSAVLTLNSDGFSLIGSTNSNRTVTVTGSDITLTGGGNTLTLTGSISLPAPTQHGLAYGSSGTAVAFLTAGGSGASVLSQTSGSAPVYLGQSQLVVGGASTAANIFGGATNQLHYQTAANTTGFITNAAGSGASVLTQTSGSAPVYLPQSQLVVGGATTAAQWQTARTVTFATGDVTGSFSINGSADVSNVALTIAANSVALGTDTTGNYAQSVAVSGSGITLGGTAGEGTNFTVYSSGTSANTVSTLVFRDGSGNFSAGTITATSFSGTASSAALVNTDATTATRYIVGTALNTASGSVQLSTGSGITIGNNLLTSGAVAVTNSTISTSTTTGALIVTGGVGIGGSLWTDTADFSSISGVGFLGSAITSGVWAGTAISIARGGTNGTATPTSGAVAYGTGTAYAFTTAGTSGSVLVSQGASAPIFSTVALGSANSISGTLGISNGGTNATTQTTNGVNYYNGTSITSSSSMLYVSGAGLTATESIRAAGFNIAGNSVITSVTPSGGSAVYGALTLAVQNTGSSNTLSIAGSGQSITITGPGSGITGSGSANSLAKFSAAGTITNANATDNGTTFAISLPTTVTSTALTSGTYLTITTAAGDDNSTSDYFIRGLNSSSTSKFSVDANGNLRATTKSFDIEHPTKPGMRLVYGVLEGPEHGVYHRGTVEGKGKITVELPEYWSKLVGENYSIQITAWGNYNVHIVEKSETSFIIQLTGDPISRMLKTIKADYIIHGSRLDAPLEIEQK